jgi:hypothetical protein
MGIELVNAGETLAAIVVSNELSNQANGGGDNPPSGTHGDPTATCANCGTNLTGAYCHACGQSSHIHRSLLHMFEEVLHGIFHFDTKAWRTVPALIFRPGHLTREYIQGKRTSFVSPLALFLFLIFLMFFVFSLTMKGPGNAFLHIPETREQIVKELSNNQATLAEQQTKMQQLPVGSSDVPELSIEIRETQMTIRELEDQLDLLDGKKIDVTKTQALLNEAESNFANLKKLKAQQKARPESVVGAASGTLENASASDASSTTKVLPPWELENQILFAQREVKYQKKRLAKANRIEANTAEDNAAANASSAASNSDAATSANSKSASTALSSVAHSAEASTSDDEKNGNDDEINNLSDIPYIGKALAHAEKNRELTLYKMKKNAASSAFLLMPISLPFLWLLFAFKRQYVMFDHAVFSLYSLSFMCLLLMTIAILGKFNFSGTAGFLFMTVPPIHMFVQLRHAYQLSILSTIWRTIALLLIAFLSLLIYATLVTMLST